MGNNLFVAGIPYELTQEELAKLFGECGGVANVKILMDRATGRSRGIGFVVMATEAEAQAAIKKLNGSTVGARQIFVTEARPSDKPADQPADGGYTGPERRSGKDRRRSPPAVAGPSAEPRPWERERKPWAKKPWDKGGKPAGFGARKPWKKPWDKGGRPGGSGTRKPWERGPGGPGEGKPWRKPWDKGGKPAGFGARKPWDKKPGGFGAKKPWRKKPGPRSA